MIIRGSKAPTVLSTEVYIRMKTNNTLQYNEWRKQTTKCVICSKVMKQGSLQRHIEQVHNKQPNQYVCQEVTSKATFNINIEKGKYNNCPIPGCIGGSRDKCGIY